MIKQIISHPISSSFLIIAYVVSSLLISLWVSSSVYIKQLALEKVNGLSSNAFNVSINFGEILGKLEVEEILINKLENNYIRFESEGIEFDSGKKGEVILEHFTDSSEAKYPLIEGKYLSNDNMKNKDKVALIGNDLRDELYKKDNKDYIKIYLEEYQVIGMIGSKKEGYWSNKIIVPLTASPVFFESKLSGEIPFNFFVDNSNNDILKECQNLSNYVNKDYGRVEIKELDEKNNVVIDNFSNIDIELGLMVLGIAVLNMINISIYWYDDIKKEVGIRKAFGSTNYDIGKMIITQLFFICIIGFLISLGIQFILGTIINYSTNITFNITLSNLIVGIMISLGASIISSIIPIYKSIKTQPIEIVKR